VAINSNLSSDSSFPLPAPAEKDYPTAVSHDNEERTGVCSCIMSDFTILLRLFLALIFGGLIGFERRWRGHAAGPHTNGLVALGAAIFVIGGQELGGDGAARVLAQVATGIGFLAGGVILRDGLRVRGLNTAATVWCVAAIGSFTGLGRLTLAGGATLLVLAGNSLFHLLEHHIRRLSSVPEDADLYDRDQKRD
jgi:putative Mg2+ transporter-C (MgtC) family protein